MDHEVKQSKGSQPPHTHSEHRKRDKENEGENQLYHIWLLWHTISTQGAWKCHEQQSFVPNTDGEPPFSTTLLTFLVGKQPGPQEDPPDRMDSAKCKLPLVPSGNLVSWGPRRI